MMHLRLLFLAYFAMGQKGVISNGRTEQNRTRLLSASVLSGVTKNKSPPRGIPSLFSASVLSGVTKNKSPPRGIPSLFSASVLSGVTQNKSPPRGIPSLVSALVLAGGTQSKSPLRVYPSKEESPEENTSPEEPCDNRHCKQGVIVSGGFHKNDPLPIASTEVYFPPPCSGCTSSLPSMPSARVGHTLDQIGNGKVLACGGVPDKKTCDKFDGTSWSPYSTLLYNRSYHNSLPDQTDLLLLGGELQSTTELVKAGVQQYTIQPTLPYGWACGITEPGSDYIIMAGGFGLKTVNKYTLKGFVRHLPDLTIDRASPGCGVLKNILGKKVYVVAGGYSSSYSGYLSSTELLTDGELRWMPGNPLPRALYLPASVSFDGYVLLLGGSDSSRQILMFNSSLVWSPVGNLKKERTGAAAALVVFDKVQLD